MSIYSRNSVHTVSQWNIFDSRTNLYPDNRWSCNHCNGRFPSKGSTPGHIVQFQVLFSCRTSVDPDLFHYSKRSTKVQSQPSEGHAPGGCDLPIQSVLVRFLPLQFCQLRFHLRNQRLQLLLAFLARMRIHIPRVLFAVDPCRGVSYMVSPKVKYISSPSRSAARSLILSSHL